MTLGSGQQSLWAAAVQAVQDVGSHLACPPVLACPQLSRVLTLPEPVASLGREGARLPGQPELGGQGLGQVAG